MDLEPTQTIAVLSQLAENSTTGLLQSIPDDDPPLIKFRALQCALFSTCFVEILGGVFFLITAIYIDRDRARVEAVVLELMLRIEDCSNRDHG
ncbi:protein spinster-like [Anopheles moucheti]|uniref:protein spinster-like n=1 Tax=Anopheles moucheti TaxID=186751 RepID=UPI0022F03853|nr:protein spinster-like [Anopheles moucheti]